MAAMYHKDVPTALSLRWNLISGWSIFWEASGMISWGWRFEEEELAAAEAGVGRLLLSQVVALVEAGGRHLLHLPLTAHTN